MRVARSVLYGLVSCLMLFSLSWAVQRGFFGEAPDVGEDRLRQTSRVGRPVARVVAAPAGEDDASAPADEDDVAIDPADIDSGQREAKQGPATRGTGVHAGESAGSPGLHRVGGVVGDLLDAARVSIAGRPRVSDDDAGLRDARGDGDGGDGGGPGAAVPGAAGRLGAAGGGGGRR